MLVAPIQMVDAVQHRLALGGEPRQHQGDRGPEIGRHDLGAGQLRPAANHGRGAVHVQVGAHAGDRKSTRLNSSHSCASRMPSSARNKKTTYNTYTSNIHT